jgi:hypothetical protein
MFVNIFLQFIDDKVLKIKHEVKWHFLLISMYPALFNQPVSTGICALYGSSVLLLLPLAVYRTFVEALDNGRSHSMNMLARGGGGVKVEV